MYSQFVTLTQRGERMAEELGKQAWELEVMCTTAYNIWDAETPDDVILAKQGCNGVPKNKFSEGFPPCPLREFCLDTSIELNAWHGVWGGKSPYERKVIARKRLGITKIVTPNDD